MKTKAEAHDVWWCWITNDPSVIEFQGDSPKCVECGWVDESAVNCETSESFRAEHTYCCHVTKPKREEIHNV